MSQAILDHEKMICYNEEDKRCQMCWDPFKEEVNSHPYCDCDEKFVIINKSTTGLLVLMPDLVECKTEAKVGD